MSAADEAWRDWQMRWVVDESRAGRLAGYTGNQLQGAAFMAGYRRALEDAADECDVRQMGAKVDRRDAEKGTHDEFFKYGKQRAWGEARTMLRVLARAAAPRETKD